MANTAPPPTPPLTPEQRRAFEELYRQQVSAVRSLARMLGKPCPIKDKDERRACDTPSQAHTDRRL